MAFDEEAIETLLLKDNNLEIVCLSPQIKKAFFLFEMPIDDDLLLVIEKSKCDAAFYYDKRSYDEEEARRLFQMIKDDAADFLHAMKKKNENTLKEEKDKTNINVLKSFRNLTTINKKAYAVAAADDNLAECLLLDAIRRHAHAGDKVIVICADDDSKVKEIKKSHLNNGEIVLLKTSVNDYMTFETELILNYISDVSEYNVIYVLGLEHNEQTNAYLDNLDKIAEGVNVPIFASVNSLRSECPVPDRTFEIKAMPEYSTKRNSNLFCSLSFNESDKKSLLAYDSSSGRFIEAEFPLDEDNDL